MKSSHQWSFAVTLAGFVVMLASPHARGDALTHLQLRNPLPTPDQVRTIGFGAGVFIAADQRGDVFTSPDGVVWTAKANVGTNFLLRFAYGAGRFVAFSSSGNVLSSEDGSIWTLRATAPPGRLSEIVYGNGTFLAVGGDRVMTSPDGMAWTTTFDVSGPGGGFIDVAYGNGIFAAVMIVGFIFTSVDGIIWTPHQPDAGYSLSSYIAFGNGAFLVPGFSRGPSQSQLVPGSWFSTNGSVWTRLSTNAFSVSYPIFGGGTFVGSGSQFGRVFTSTDGTNWASTTLSQGTIETAGYGNGVFVGVGAGHISRSANGLDWTDVPVTAADRSYSTSAGAYGAGRYVLVGPSVVTSTDGINFTRNSVTYSDGLFVAVNAITYSAGQFVAVGVNGNINRSPDGLAWNTVRSGTVKTLSSIAFGAGRYVAVGADGAIRVSVDGELWAGAWSGTDYNLNGVAFGNGRFVSVGHRGIVLTSPEGLNWTPQPNNDLSTLHKVTFAGSRFVAVGTNGAVVTSANGTTWTRHTTGITNSLQNITYGDGLYVAVGSGGGVFSSTDGMAWQERPELGVKDVTGSAFLNGVWLLGGSGGTIYGTEPGALILSAANNPTTATFEVTVSGCQFGVPYQLQSRTNLSTETWKDVTTFVPTQSVTVVPVPGGVGAPECYYRVVTTP